MEINIENNEKMSTNYYLWSVAICNTLAYFLVFITGRGSYSNCYLTQCAAFDWASVLFGTIGLTIALIHLKKNKDLKGKKKSTIIGLALIAFGSITYGLGFGPGSICPEYVPAC